MEIGSKIRSARTGAGLTQEKAAEALGVSRQTISNWENGRTYPDIVSVIKMSDLYQVSLDHLLKGEDAKPQSDYIDYLEESTNMVKGKEKQSRLMVVLAYLVIWAAGVMTFWVFTDGEDGMAYSLAFLWVLLPVATFVVSVLIGRNDFWKEKKWLTVAVMGVMYMLAEYATFSAANMVSFGKVNLPEFSMIATGGVISLAGLLGGVAARRLMKKRTQKA